LNSTLFNRADERNPLRDAHFVFVPYCTADAFLGDRVADLTGGLFNSDHRQAHFAGAANIRAYLRRLAPTFRDVDHIVLGGSSAGGFGAAGNWYAVKEAFPNARVDLLDDSGPPLEPDGDLWQTWQAAWGVKFPEGCTGCERRVTAMVDFARERLLGQGRMGLMSYRRDTIISTFFSLLPIVFEERLSGLADLFDLEDDAQYFLVPGRLHTFLIIGFDQIESETHLPLWRWIEQMIEGDPDWGSYRQ
ncbi:MAG: hypothetical protein KC620_00150, partial [Myxococcales bacterium]|nr:hypothetical protein [Myxococcales bacterium]